jgi:hypothetical protein
LISVEAEFVLLLLLASAVLCSQGIVVYASPEYDHAPRLEPTRGIMYYTPDQLHRSVKLDRAGPRASIDPNIVMAASSSFSLLTHLDYVPSERDQGWAGNCWVWAGTGVTEIALDVQKETKDRLSIQYFDSNYYYNYPAPTGNWAGAGGDLDSFAPSMATGNNHGILELPCMRQAWQLRLTIL